MKLISNEQWQSAEFLMPDIRTCAAAYLASVSVRSSNAMLKHIDYIRF